MKYAMEQICRVCGGGGSIMAVKNDGHTFDEFETCPECCGMGVMYITPEEKANEYLAEFSIEKSIDLVETMIEVSESIPSLAVTPEYYKSVLKVLNKKLLT